MKIDNAIKEFSEKYDREAMKSIEDLAGSFTYTIKPHYIKAFDLKESFDGFVGCISKYGLYKIQNVGNEYASPQAAIVESVNKFMDSQFFKESDLKYEDFPTFVKSYVEGITNTIDAVNKVKSDMVDADIDLEYVGEVNTFCDKFMTVMQEKFDNTMDLILRTTGYTTRKNLAAIRPTVEEKHVFL